jgi:hypothetical protein
MLVQPMIIVDEACRLPMHFTVVPIGVDRKIYVSGAEASAWLR